MLPCNKSMLTLLKNGEWWLFYNFINYKIPQKNTMYEVQVIFMQGYMGQPPAIVYMLTMVTN